LRKKNKAEIRRNFDARPGSAPRPPVIAKKVQVNNPGTSKVHVNTHGNNGRLPYRQRPIEYAAAVTEGTGGEFESVKQNTNSNRNGSQVKLSNLRQAKIKPKDYKFDGMDAETDRFLRSLADKDDYSDFLVEDEETVGNGKVYYGTDVPSTRCIPQKTVQRYNTEPMVGGAVKSGLHARHSDKVKTVQEWAHAALPEDYTSGVGMSFGQLDFRLLVAGEVEIILESNIDETEKEGRLCLLRSLAFLLGTYPWATVQSVYATVLRKIELGKLNWKSDMTNVIQVVLFSAGSTKTQEVRGEKGGTSQKKRSNTGIRVWYCPITKEVLAHSLMPTQKKCTVGR